MNTTKGLLVPLAVLLLSLGCMKKSEPDRYRVVGYDSAKKQWTIIHTGNSDGKHIREKLVVACDFYKAGEDQSVIHPGACRLDVGRLLVPNESSDPKKSLDIFKLVFPSDQALVMIKGDGSDEVAQHFSIVKDEILPEKN